MFKNIGKKIKVIAYISFIICSIVGVLYGIGIGSEVNSIYGARYEFNFSWLGILIAVLIILASWMASCFTYGFGELIENTGEIKKKIQTQPVEQEKPLSE